MRHSRCALKHLLAGLPRSRAVLRSRIPVSPRSSVCVDCLFPHSESLVDRIEFWSLHADDTSSISIAPVVDQDYDSISFPDLIIDNFIMAYTVFPARAAAVSAHRFCRLTIFNDIVVTWREVNFSANAERQRVLQSLRDLPAERVVSVNRRFPDSGLYIDLTSGIVADLLDAIRNSCDFGLRGHDNVGLEKSNFGDARIAFTHAVRRLIELPEMDETSMVAYRIFSRATFEDYFGLVWA